MERHPTPQKWDMEDCKQWLEFILQEKLPNSRQIIDELCNGVLLAKLAHFIAPETVTKEHIYDIDMLLYNTKGLQFKHIDNINCWLKVIKQFKLKIYPPEAMDIYNKRHLSQTISCIYAVSIELSKLGRAPLMKCNSEKVSLSEDVNLIKCSNYQSKLEISSNHQNIENMSNDGCLLSVSTSHEQDENEQKIGALELCLQLNKELENGDSFSFFLALMKLDLELPEEFIEYAAPLYFEELKTRKLEKGSLTIEEFKAGILICTHTAYVSQAVDEHCQKKTIEALDDSVLRLKGRNSKLNEQYYLAILSCRKFKKLEKCNCTLLSLSNIQDCIDLVNSNFEFSNHVDHSLNRLTKAVSEKHYEQIFNIIEMLDFEPSVEKSDTKLLCTELEAKLHSSKTEMLSLEDVELALKQSYYTIQQVKNDLKFLQVFNAAVDTEDITQVGFLLHMFSDYTFHNINLIFNDVLKTKKALQGNSDWVKHCSSNNYKLFLNLVTEEYSWSCSEKDVSSRFLSYKHLQDIVAYWTTFNFCEVMTAFQAQCRGYLLRRSLLSHKYFLKNVDQIIKIQKWWRNIHKNILKVDTAVVNLADNTSNSSQEAFTKNIERSAVKIQAIWRGARVRSAFRAVFSEAVPSFKSLKLFFSLVDITTRDYERELNLQSLRSEVVQLIRSNKNLSAQVDRMDITIGLLVQNRISVMEAVVEKKSFSFGGLKCLRADSQRMLKAYQHLFYLLQTSPNYLASLLFCLPTSNSSRFLESVILTLYNFGANRRNEYHLLKLFQHALLEEINCRFKNPSDAISGNPLVLRVVINYARHTGYNALRHILGPPINKILNSKDCSIDTNPISIYTYWRNEEEYRTGIVSDLSYYVSKEEALKQEEVICRLNRSIELLTCLVQSVLNRLRKHKGTMPYGLCLIAKELYSGLQAKFPTTPTKEILKVVGNLLYYQFINSAIVAPDAYGIIALPPGKTLTYAQRNTLASIASVLQYAATKKGFGEESKHLMCLNSFITDCHEQFKQFFIDCCNVEDLESHYSVTEFTEATLIFRPTIYISLKEIINTHTFLIDYIEEIAPDKNDPLRSLLHDLGPVPTLGQLSGLNISKFNERRLGEAEVCLTLVNKFEAQYDDTDIVQQFIRAKKLIGILLPYFKKGNTFPGALRTEFSSEDEQNYARKKIHSLHHASFGNLQNCKNNLNKLLAELCKEGLVAIEDGYQSILTAIAMDIRNKTKYRQIQTDEFTKIRLTKTSLEEKNKYLLDQVNYYNAYIDRCLENLNAGSRNIHAKQPCLGREKNVLKNVLKYNGAKLHEKGVLISIDGLPVCQLKNVHIEISPTNTNGVFEVCGKFMGVEVEKVEADIQKLLQLQYEGVTIMNIFGKAKVNINLLLYLLNKKYYKK